MAETFGDMVKSCQISFKILVIILFRIGIISGIYI